jgi:hypothetical protein
MQPTKDDLIDAGFMQDGNLWIHPTTGEMLSFQQARDEYQDVVDENRSDLDDSMDGDFDSGMASAGFGTDEDYGYYGGEE